MTDDEIRAERAERAEMLQVAESVAIDVTRREWMRTVRMAEIVAEHVVSPSCGCVRCLEHYGLYADSLSEFVR